MTHQGCEEQSRGLPDFWTRVKYLNRSVGNSAESSEKEGFTGVMKAAKNNLTVETLCEEASRFAEEESQHLEPSLYGVTDGKAVGTYLEHKFKAHLRARYIFQESSSAKGIDFPELLVDIKVTSFRQPQSSCPYKSANQKIYGLGYSLLVFVYQKNDVPESEAARLNILHTVFVEKERTGDYQTTSGLRNILENNGNQDDLIGFMADRMLPVDDIQAAKIAGELLRNPPQLGYLTISNALQWRLQYSRVIDLAGTIEGIIKVR